MKQILDEKSGLAQSQPKNKVVNTLVLILKALLDGEPFQASQNMQK